jgi:segregation and condensation protein B
VSQNQAPSLPENAIRNASPTEKDHHMTASSLPPSDDPEDLGRSYGAHLEGHAWELDVGEATGPGEHSSETPAAAAPPLHRIIEALLFIGGPPLTAVRAGEAIRGLNAAQFTQAIDTLNKDYRHQGRPYTIRPQDQGYVLALRPRFRPLVAKLYGGPREARLSPQAIDVLALVAYRQPSTKVEIDSLRGIESGALLRQLVRRGLVAVVQRGESGQREVSYGTTARFLELFGLTSLDDLPQTQDLQML